MNRSTPEPPEDIESLPFGVRFLSLVAGLMLVLLGGKSLISDYRILHKLTHLDSEYRETPATMLQVRVRRDSAESGDKYYPDVLFEYFVNGQSVWGWRFSLEEEARPKAYWEKRLNSYHIGDPVTAHVSPLDPKDSFVETKRDSLLRPVLKLLMAAVFVLFGMLLFAFPVASFAGKVFRSSRGS
ncbi:MAG TPA: hypothetical protein DCQ83_01745 [Fibrobacteres bacterium]|jgi:hypothetical protein|nr:hypothetical protein [Fibrobacterota bacterium]